LLARLEQIRQSRGGGDAVERERDAFQLFGGMGPCLYVTRTGEFLVGADEVFDEPELRSADENEAITALVIGSKLVPELLELTPGRPEGVNVCGQCEGSRWFPLGSNVIICTKCRGRGWVT